MADDLLQRAGVKLLGRDDTTRLGAELPVADDDLDRLLAQAVAARDDLAFTNLTLAALGTGRRVDAKHLAQGTVLFPQPRYLAVAVMNCSGDVAAALTVAVESGKLGRERDATALLLAGVWCQERRSSVFPQALISLARTAARKSGDNALVKAELYALSLILKDPGLTTILEREDVSELRLLAREIMTRLLEHAHGQILDAVTEESPEPFTGHTIRRSVERVGRNDPCPCGSGKKYKRCCAEKDQRRLVQSSPVPGLTVEELRAQPEAFLSRERIADMRPHELARVDFRKVKAELHPYLVNRLQFSGELEAMVRLFEEVGLHDGIRGHWPDVVQGVTQRARRDLLERLLALHPNREAAEGKLELGSRLLLASGRASDPLLQMIEEQARRALADEKTVPVVELGYDLLDSAYPALGILLARGVVPIASRLDAWALLDVMLRTRDKLNLSPDDPIESVFERLSDEEQDADETDSTALAEARQRLEAKANEVRKLRDELEALKECVRRQPQGPTKAPTPSATQPASVPPPEDPALHDLRRRMRVLESDLKERHSERNHLRRELEQAREEMKTLRAEKEASQPSSPADSEAGENTLLLEEETLGLQPPRLPAFTARFRESLRDLPETVVRAALRLVGRLASGDEAAFRGSRRLRARRDLLRQRVGSDHRLFFRLERETLEVVALIARSGFERFLRTLGRNS